MMSPGLSRFEARILHARETLAFQSRLARNVRANERLHRSAMQGVFMAEDSLFLLIETHEMISRLEVQRFRSTSPTSAATDVKATSGS